MKNGFSLHEGTSGSNNRSTVNSGSIERLALLTGELLSEVFSVLAKPSLAQSRIIFVIREGHQALADNSVEVQLAVTIYKILSLG